MMQKKIVVLGTPGGSWMAGARRLLGADSPAVHIGTESDLQRIDAFADARLLVLVDDAALTLARHLVREPGLDIEAWMDAWVQAGQRLLHLLQTRPGQALFVSWTEALAAPDAFAASLRERLGVVAASRTVEADASADPAAVALSRLALARHRQASAIAAELGAACIALSDAAAADDESPDPAPQSDYLRDVSLAWSTVAGSRRALLETSRSEATAVARVRDLDRELASASSALRGTERALNEATGARIAARDDLASLELKLAFDAQDRAAKVLALDAAKQRLDEVQGERDACRHELDRHARQVATLQARMLQFEKEDAHLLMQLHDTQELAERELAARHLARDQLGELSGQLAARQAGDTLTAAQVLLGARRDDEPYRELDVALAGVRLHDAILGDFDVRLIEHRGHPGLVFFEGGAERQLLSCWRESGSEGERRFMLLVPVDEGGAALLDRLPSADRRCLDDVIGLLERALIAAPGHAAWLAVVRRLQVEIKERKPRFRFNEMDVHPVEAMPSMLEVAFIDAEFGVRSWAILRARWQPGAEHPVELVHGGNASDMFPLRDWRRLAGEPAQPLEIWALPLASAPGRSEGFDAWQALDSGDAALLTALLDALPAAAHRAVERELVPSEDAARLLGEAHLLLRLIPVPPAPPSRGWRGAARKAVNTVRGRRSDATRGQGAAA
jgi:hypothetical protein